MPLSSEMRRLQASWTSGQNWPKRLEWLEIQGIRGWTNQRIDFTFPIVALVGETALAKVQSFNVRLLFTKVQARQNYTRLTSFPILHLRLSLRLPCAFHIEKGTARKRRLFGSQLIVGEATLIDLSDRSAILTLAAFNPLERALGFLNF